MMFRRVGCDTLCGLSAWSGERLVTLCHRCRGRGPLEAYRLAVLPQRRVPYGSLAEGIEQLRECA